MHNVQHVGEIYAKQSCRMLNALLHCEIKYLRGTWYLCKYLDDREARATAFSALISLIF